MDPSWTREQVVATIARQFAPDQRDAVLRALDIYPGDTPAGRARVQLAILKVAAGDAAKVHECAAHANVDFRDVLYTADHGVDQAGPPVLAPRPRWVSLVVWAATCLLVLLVIGYVVRVVTRAFG
jgi:hypothetical protein